MCSWWPPFRGWASRMQQDWVPCIDSKDTGIISTLITLWYLKNVIFNINIQILHAIHVLYRHPFSVASLIIIVNCYKLYVHSAVVKQCCPDTLETRICNWVHSLCERKPCLSWVSVSGLSVLNCVRGVWPLGQASYGGSPHWEQTQYCMRYFSPHPQYPFHAYSSDLAMHSHLTFFSKKHRSPRRAVESVKCVQHFRTKLYDIVGMCSRN